MSVGEDRRWVPLSYLRKLFPVYNYLVKSNCGLLSMLRSDWLSYY